MLGVYGVNGMGRGKIHLILYELNDLVANHSQKRKKSPFPKE